MTQAEELAHLRADVADRARWLTTAEIDEWLGRIRADQTEAKLRLQRLEAVELELHRAKAQALRFRRATGGEG